MFLQERGNVHRVLWQELWQLKMGQGHRLGERCFLGPGNMLVIEYFRKIYYFYTRLFLVLIGTKLFSFCPHLKSNLEKNKNS